MSSPTGGAPIGPQEASDLLHKLITESTRVQAAFIIPSSGVQAFVCGVLRTSPAPNGGDLVNVLEREHDPETGRLCFNPWVATSVRYGDDRVFKSNPDALGFFKQHFTSALTFLFGDGSSVALFEVADKE